MTSSLSATISSLIVIGGGVVLGIIHYNGGSPGDPEGVLASAAFAAPTVLAGVLALLGVWRRQLMVTAGSGMGLIPICLVSVVMLPLLIPAALLVAHGLSRSVDRATYEAPVSFVVAIGLCGAFFLLLVHDDPVSWSTPSGTGGSSDIITTVEALASLSILSAVFAAAMLTPRRR